MYFLRHVVHDTNELFARYVLSPTHLHEFKSADHISAQQPIMSLYLPEQKLGSHSSITSSSHKFMLKGRQTGAMHRGHAWVFRAESHDTMLAWYEDIKSLTEKTGEERNAFVRRHARSVSGGSHKTGSISSDGAMDEDEADEVPYSANATEVQQPVPKQDTLERPQPGGRFPSDLDVNRFLQAPLSPSSAASSGDPDTVIAVGTHPDNGAPLGQRGEGHDSTQGGLDAQHLVNTPHDQQQHDLARQSPEYNYQPVQSQGNSFRIIPYESEPAQKQHRNIAVQSPPKEVPRHDSNYGNWMTSGTVGTKDIAARVVDSETRGQRLNGVEENHGSEYANEAHNTTVVSSTNTTAPAATGLPAKTESSRSALDKPGIGITQTVTSHYMPSNVNDTPLDKSINDNSSAWTKSQGGDAIESPVFVAPHQGQTPDAAGTLTSVTSARPALPSHTSVQTISDLHVPGEYPPTPLA